jgi:hypothetical protein
MKCFERYFCRSGMTDTDLLGEFHGARRLDNRVRRLGHWSVPRIQLLWSTPFGATLPEDKKSWKQRGYFWVRRNWFKDASAEE